MSQRVKTSARGLVLPRSSSPENGHLRKKMISHTAKNGNCVVLLVRNRLYTDIVIYITTRKEKIKKTLELLSFSYFKVIVEDDIDHEVYWH